MTFKITDEEITLMAEIERDHVAFALLWRASANTNVYQVLRERGDPREWPEYPRARTTETLEAVDG